ncbi:ribonuclease III [Chloriridovirus anopheles1]|uniref:Ribonuclease III n=1 Tax=Chloriridovirus anopheles1 TaxID=1465751 RepID=W8QF70_9VIRU|nr:ribonuclease III [Anopheles minimus iridovirus]AHL67624.1 ribonuclease III [Anopheles minimus iridovirus]
MNNISKINLYCQKKRLNPPLYETLKKEGLDHRPNFRVRCSFESLAEFGTGPTLKIAKENAAAQIVELLDLDAKLKDLDNKVGFAIESYNAPLRDIWEGNCKEYTLTIRKKDGTEYEYKNFTVKIVDI